MEKFQKICVTGFIYKDDKVLILKRSKEESFLPEYWELPGGKVEFGESLEESMNREMKEETGLEIKNIKPYSSFSYVSQDGQRHTVDVQFLAEIKGGPSEVEISDAHSESLWVGENELHNFKLSDLMKEAIIKGFKGGRVIK
jgi:8-oxo-dGTP diphosphatase